MSSPSTPVSNTALWAGRILSALPVLLFLTTGFFSLLKPAVTGPQMAHYGYPPGTVTPIVIAEIVCAIVYAIPSTSVFGAILLTGYLGGATSTHVRAGEPFIMPVAVGIVIWLGLYLRDARLRALVPLTSSNRT